MLVTVLLLSMFETINLSLLKILFQEKNILEVFLIRLDSSSNVYSIRLDDAEEKENKKKAREEMLKTANMRWDGRLSLSSSSSSSYSSYEVGRLTS